MLRIAAVLGASAAHLRRLTTHALNPEEFELVWEVYLCVAFGSLAVARWVRQCMRCVPERFGFFTAASTSRPTQPMQCVPDTLHNLGCCRVGQSVGDIALQWRIVDHASDDVATTVDGSRGIETRARSFTNA